MATRNKTQAENKQGIANQQIQKRKHLANAKDNGLQLVSLNTIINVREHTAW